MQWTVKLRFISEYSLCFIAFQLLHVATNTSANTLFHKLFLSVYRHRSGMLFLWWIYTIVREWHPSTHKHISDIATRRKLLEMNSQGRCVAPAQKTLNIACRHVASLSILHSVDSWTGQAFSKDVLKVVESHLIDEMQRHNHIDFARTLKLLRVPHP